ncbi:MAG: hypothetical protein QOD72_2786 [Acidimicrobiaceae bacterium]|nr:hypothetical protein [Acidimicrobiaceae bacterium]
MTATITAITDSTITVTVLDATSRQIVLSIAGTPFVVNGTPCDPTPLQVGDTIGVAYILSATDPQTPEEIVILPPAQK